MLASQTFELNTAGALMSSKRWRRWACRSSGVERGFEYREAIDKTNSLFVWLVADGWCWFVLRGKVLLAGCWWLICCERKVLLAGG
jgi:hypothetical protein